MRAQGARFFLCDADGEVLQTFATEARAVPALKEESPGTHLVHGRGLFAVAVGTTNSQKSLLEKILEEGDHPALLLGGGEGTEDAAEVSEEASTMETESEESEDVLTVIEDRKDGSEEDPYFAVRHSDPTPVLPGIKATSLGKVACKNASQGCRETTSTTGRGRKPLPGNVGFCRRCRAKRGVFVPPGKGSRLPFGRHNPAAPVSLAASRAPARSVPRDALAPKSAVPSGARKARAERSSSPLAVERSWGLRTFRALRAVASPEAQALAIDLADALLGEESGEKA